MKIDQKYSPEEADFKVPISKYYSLFRKSIDDFEIKQVSVVILPPCPMLDIVRKPIGSKSSPNVKAKPAEKISQPVQDIVAPVPQVAKSIAETSPSHEEKVTKPAENNEKAGKVKQKAQEIKEDEGGSPKRENKNENPGCQCSVL